MAQNQTTFGDEGYTYGIPDPNALLSEQQASYAQEMARAPNQSVRNVISGIGGLQNFNGGGPQMQESKLVQARMQEIMAGVNANSDPNEDPLTKQMRIAQAMQTGLAGVSPRAAMAAGEQTVKLAQAQKQQDLLTTETKQRQVETEGADFKNQILKNTPQVSMLVQDLGKDKNGLPLGFKATGTYDMSDPAEGARMRTDMQAAQANGQTLTPMTADQYANSKVQVAASNAQARYQSTLVAAMQREQTALAKLQQGQTHSAVNDRFANRMMGNTDSASDILTAVASMPFGTNTGWWAGISGARDPGESLFELGSDHMRRGLTSQDQALYNSFSAGLDRNLASLEMQGGLQGGQNFAKQIGAALKLQPEDTPLTVMGKLADARALVDHNISVYMRSKNADPQVVSYIQEQLDKMHAAIPFTRKDVIAFDRAQQLHPEVTFTEWARENELGGAEHNKPTAGQPGGTATATPALPKDENGTTARETF